MSSCQSKILARRALSVRFQCTVIPNFDLLTFIRKSTAPDYYFILGMGFTFTDEHGPFVCRYLLPPGESTVHLSQQEIWDWICKWLDMATGDVSVYTSTEFGGTRPPGEKSTHRLRALLWIVPIEAFDPRVAPYTWDLRSYCDNPGCEIHPIRAGDERRQSGLSAPNFADNIERLQAEFKCVDCDTPNQMAMRKRSHTA
jgi:hypothetical protein